MAYTKNEIINMLATVADDEVEKLRQQGLSSWADWIFEHLHKQLQLLRYS